MEPIPILHCITSLDPDGAQQMLLKLCSLSDSSRFSHSVVSLTPGGALAASFSSRGFGARSLSMRRGVPSCAALMELAQLFRATRPGIIQSWMWHANLAAALALKLSGLRVPLFWNMRRALQSSEDKLLTRTVIGLNRVFSRVPQKIIYCGRQLADEHEQFGFPAGKRLVIPNGFNTERFRPSPESRIRLRQSLGLAPGAILLGSVGRFHPQKDHKTLLTAAAIVTQSLPAVRLAIVGRGVDAANTELRNLINKLKLENCVFLLGERKDIEAVLPAFDLLCSSSTAEGFSNVIGEAMSCGVPCAVTDTGSSREVVGDAGRVVPPSDPRALAGAILHILKMPDEQKRLLQRRARERVTKNYSLERIVASYQGAYEAAYIESAQPQPARLHRSPAPFKQRDGAERTEKDQK